MEFDNRVLPNDRFRNWAKPAYVEGDATRPMADGPKILCHVCNDIGAWGKGFVLAISRRWKEPEQQYRAWHANHELNDFGLGAIQVVQVEPDLWVANMVAQRGVGRTQDGPPIRYEALAECLQKLASVAVERGASIHMPRIGCGLAGGDWSQIEPLITEHLCHRGLSITVYDFK